VAKIVSAAICAGSANLLRSDREYLFFVVRRSLCMGNGEGDVAGLSICELEPANGFPVNRGNARVGSNPSADPTLHPRFLLDDRSTYSMCLELLILTLLFRTAPEGIEGGPSLAREGPQTATLPDGFLGYAPRWASGCPPLTESKMYTSWSVMAATWEPHGSTAQRAAPRPLHVRQLAGPVCPP